MALVPGPQQKKVDGLLQDQSSAGWSLFGKPAKAKSAKSINLSTDVEKGKATEQDQGSSSSKSKAKSKANKDKAKDKEKVGDDDKLEFDPEDDVWALDEGKPSVGRKYARSVIEAFHPIMYPLIFLGLFPLVPRRAKDGTYSIKFSWFSYATILFLLFSTLVICSTLWMMASVISIAINLPEHPNVKGKSSDIFRSEEIFIYKRNVLTLVIMLASFIHLTICMVAVFHRADYIAKQLVYWTEVVELLQLDVGRNVPKRLWRQLTIMMIFGAVMLALYALDVSPGLTGSGSTFYVVMTRMVTPISHWSPGMGIRRIGFATFLSYCIIAGYLYILWFFWNCRILTNILRIWNNRFQYCLHKQILEFSNIQQSKEIRLGVRAANRTSRANLFQDHLVIFNLLEGINSQFEIILESFYLTTMIMIVFEAYGFVHACFYDEYIKCNRQTDMLPILLILALQMYLYIIVTLEAAGVADEARLVLDVVRRKGMMTSRMDNELWFMLSMRLSFGGHEDVGIIGAGFFYITKSFLLGAMSAMASHFIIYYQFEVPYAQTVEADANYARLDIKNLISHLEGEAHRMSC